MRNEPGGGDGPLADFRGHGGQADTAEMRDCATDFLKLAMSQPGRQFQRLDHPDRDGFAHPAFTLGLANWVLSANVRLGPWIHVESRIRHLAPIPLGTVVTVEAVVTDLVVGAAVAVVAGLVAAVVASSVGLDGRLGDAVAVVSGGVVGGTVYLVGQQLLGATKPTNVASLVRKST